MVWRQLVCVGFALSGCARVPYHQGEFGGIAAVRTSCDVRHNTQVARLSGKDGLWYDILRSDIEAEATAPRFIPKQGFRGPARLTYELHSGELTNVVGVWSVRGEEVCLTVEGDWVQHHIPDSATIGPDGELQSVTHTPVGLGPWCSSKCEVQR